jgi:hypothetical protein
MTEFRTTATHGDRAVPMPEVNAATCDAETLDRLRVVGYLGRDGTRGVTDVADFRDRIRADALASAAPSEDAIRAAKYEALEEARDAAFENTQFSNDDVSRVKMWLHGLMKQYAPRPVYAAPVVLGNGDTFGQTGPDKFTRTLNKGSAFDASAQYWRDCNGFRPADGALVLSVLDGAERAR